MMNDTIDWGAATQEVVSNLSHLIQVDTTNPPGNELPAILMIKEILEKEGISEQDFTIVESAPGRANLVARLRGDGSKRPLLLSGHVDVVPVEREHWKHDPFGGQVIDGAVWGRGALDMKGFVAMYLQVFLLARRRGVALKRDVILATIADEEAGFEHGSRFLVDKHRDLIESEYALTEGGAMTFHLGKLRVYPIQVAEKGVCWLRLKTRGQPGHGSMPHDDNAVFHLAEALERLRRAGHLPVHITPTFRKLLDNATGQVGLPYGPLLGLLRYPVMARLLLRVVPSQFRGLFSALITNTVSPTILKAGSKTNVIPSIAEADLDCRTLPGQTPERAIGEIQAVMGEEVTLELVKTSPGTEFSTDTPLFRLLEGRTREMDPGGIVVPFMTVGATDASEYQRAGITVYGFTPGMLPPEFPILKLAHGHDERIPISFIETGLPVLWDVVSQFCIE